MRIIAAQFAFRFNTSVARYVDRIYGYTRRAMQLGVDETARTRACESILKDLHFLTLAHVTLPDAHLSNAVCNRLPDSRNHGQNSRFRRLRTGEDADGGKHHAGRRRGYI